MKDIADALRDLADKLDDQTENHVEPTLEGIAKALEELLARQPQPYPVYPNTAPYPDLVPWREGPYSWGLGTVVTN